MSEEIKLKPCPHCARTQRTGVKLHAREEWMVERFFVMCEHCGCRTKGFKTPEEAAESWNRRAGRKELWEEIERCLDETGFHNPDVSLAIFMKNEAAKKGTKWEKVLYRRTGFPKEIRSVDSLKKTEEQQREDIMKSVAELSEDFPQIYFFVNLWECSFLERKNGTKIFVFEAKAGKLRELEPFNYVERKDRGGAGE